MGQPSRESSSITREDSEQREPETESQSCYSYSYGLGYFDPEQGYVMEYHGPFTGVGPSGYLRSDDRIRKEVCDRLVTHVQLNATEVEVEVKEGEVILKGSVDDRLSKRLAEDLALSVPGVAVVQNQLRIQRRAAK